MFSYLFGGNSQQKKDAPKKAIIELREHILTLGKKRDHLEQQMADQDSLARKYVASKQTALAKSALKRKKGYETNLVKVENQIETLTTQLDSIEGANLNLETMKAMKQGAKVMKQMHGEYNVDKVEDTMEEIREQVELADEISEAISRPVGAEYIDEDELEEELAALEQEEQEKHEVPVQKVNQQKEEALPDFPAVNKTVPAAPVTEDDEDEEALKALQAEMGL